MTFIRRRHSKVAEASRSAREVMQQVIPWAACLRGLVAAGASYVRQQEACGKVRKELPAKYTRAKQMHKTPPLQIDANVKANDLAGYKAPFLQSRATPGKLSLQGFVLSL